MNRKLIYAAGGLVVVTALAGAGYFFRSSFLPTKSPPPPAVAQAPHLELPAGAILIPAGDGICRVSKLDNATGRIVDYGATECSKASNENSDAWNRAMSQDKFVEIGKSFRHEGAPP